ncbi:general secretion pathway protein [Flavobacterium suaedae]|uniref:General secretion pathway protein n=1 Tax=Flavobacterium suaedae TaxID=1767027 RepID=A0ABQ1JS56_9FLAO|nr:general secretion pathway protein [Flavobacterium suaedae]GGB73338.1 general secretion pathway protein [Flavobacterium suaedae]
MIEVFLKLFICFVFFIIFWQDVKYREVYWFLYPLVGVLAFSIYYLHAGLMVTVTNTTVNSIINLIIIFITAAYSKFIAKKSFLNTSIGIGDVLMFLFLSATFASITYIVLLVFSLIFSLSMHLLLKQKTPHNTVPLAGYMAMFFASVYVVSFFIKPHYLFSY